MLTTVDLFCGAGGLSEGFRKAQFKPIFASDFDEMALKTFSCNHPKIPIKHCSASELTRDVIYDTCGLNKKFKVDVLIGGPPCQGFSIAGSRLPDDPKNKLVLEFIRLTNELKPSAFLFENVPGIISMQNGNVIKVLENEFKELGYKINSRLLNPVNYGVPQSRPRFIMVGLNSRHKSKLNDMYFDFPDPINGDSIQLDFLNNKKLDSHITVGNALGDLDKLMPGEGEEVSKKGNKYSNVYQKNRRGCREPGKIFNHRATNHSEKIQNRYSAIPQGGTNKDIPVHLRTKKINVYKLDQNKYSNTVTCNFRTDLLNPWVPRGLTVREAARLQSFDDDYRFFGNLTRKAKFVTQDDQVGNAVPPLFAEAIATQIKKYLKDD
jgi:DNA (cytosine-5)-methyltransferase 1